MSRKGTVSQRELIDNLHSQGSFNSKKTIADLYNNFCDEAKDILQSGGGLYIEGVGSLVVEKRPHRIGRNPNTNTDAVYVPAGECIRFYPQEKDETISKEELIERLDKSGTSASKKTTEQFYSHLCKYAQHLIKIGSGIDFKGVGSLVIEQKRRKNAENEADPAENEHIKFYPSGEMKNFFRDRRDDENLEEAKQKLMEAKEERAKARQLAKEAKEKWEEAKRLRASAKQKCEEAYKITKPELLEPIDDTGDEPEFYAAENIIKNSPDEYPY